MATTTNQMALICSPRDTARMAQPMAHTMEMAAHSRAFGQVHTIFGFTPTGRPFELRMTRCASSGV